MQENEEVADKQNTLHVRICQQPSRRYLTVVEGIPEDKCPLITGTLKKKLACRGKHLKDKGAVEFSGDHSFNIKLLLKEILPEFEVIIHGKK
ncbi:Translation initiation factor SUI1 [Tubulinosema ratisbonensis]|uniref:Translation initiation factor SUI1 n=1 Tax=Tubulinosema ratisbonensis TaxID=291195 RepID=A0A437AK31_9MICR|nr:Translation initiation factor SUI1 [Tubulinosema ratisbonensis]